MMNIDVFFEVESKFKKRIVKAGRTFTFLDFLKENDLLNNFENKKNTSEAQTKIEYSNAKCVFDLADAAFLNSLVFENMKLFIDLLTKLGTVQMLINNPTKLLLSVLKSSSDVNLKINHSKSFPQLNTKKIDTLNTDLDRNIVGQLSAKKTIQRKLVTQLIRKESKPLVLMFYGDPGIGKTEMAKQIALTLYGKDKIVREQMSMSAGNVSLEYFKATTHNENSFSKKLLNRQSNVILLDEFALAPSYIQSSFLQLFDEGYFVDQNFEVDLRDAIIICTSNFTSKQELNRDISPALLSRFDALVRFNNFTNAEKEIIAKKMLFSALNQTKIKRKYLQNIDAGEIEKQIMNHVKYYNNFRQIRAYIEDVIADYLVRNQLL
ncbi:AAA family ATPase [Leuconostoc suionicum]|uniref:AAA family ATPase n=1 Tax=Leuconostoc suionicum TaxID=1511761 RepID=UPI0021A2B690|nr:AAA family ATPase [Leuconostoc suionicum]